MNIQASPSSPPATASGAEKKEKRIGLMRILRRVGTARWFGLLLLVPILWVRAAQPQWLETLRMQTFDVFQKVKPRDVPEQRPIVIADIDEESLAALGQWPWPRTVIAELIARLSALGVAAIGFDVVFAEADRMSPAKVVESIPALDPKTAALLKTLPDNEAMFAEAIRQSGRVILGRTAMDIPVMPIEDSRFPVPTTSIATIGADPKPFLPNVYAGLLATLPELESAGAGRGVFTVNVEADNIVRRVPAVLRIGDKIYPSLAMEMLRVATGNESLAIRTGEFGVQGVIVRPNLVKTDPQGRISVYYSHTDPGKYISIKSILDGTVDPNRLAGRLVLIGTSAVGLKDIRATSIDPAIPGVEIHAQILENILYQQQLSRPADAEGIEVLATLIGSLAMIVLVPMIGAYFTFALFALVAGGTIAWTWSQFVTSLTLYDPVYPVLAALALYLFLTITSYAQEEARRRQVRGAFSLYLSPAMVKVLEQNPDKLKLGGENRDMTLMFCDLRGFTTISELFDAQGLTRLINRFLTPMTDIILGRKGTVDKYIGDCIMAFWNAPLDDPDHASNACEASLAMNHALIDLNANLEREAKEENRRHVPLAIGIGLNAGECCVGNMGADQRFNYSALGDTVNLASRLEGQSKTYGVITVLGESVVSRAPGFAVLELDLIKVKGKTEAVRIFALLGDREMAKTAAFQALVAEHNKMLAAYRAQKWDEAEALIASCRNLTPSDIKLNGLYDLYAHRIEEGREDPPGADWDGVYVAKTK